MTLGRDDVFVFSNSFIYFREHTQARVAPDVCVLMGVPNHHRRVYKLFEERVSPTLVIEVTSRSTKKEDRVDKRAIYAEIGVKEYILIDPTAEYLHPPFQAQRLVRGAWQPMKQDAHGRVKSCIDAMFGLRDGHLRMYDLLGNDILSNAEANKGLMAAHLAAEAHAATAQAQAASAQAHAATAETRAATAEARAAAAEEENKRLRLELERIRRSKH